VAWWVGGWMGPFRCGVGKVWVWGRRWEAEGGGGSGVFGRAGWLGSRCGLKLSLRPCVERRGGFEWGPLEVWGWAGGLVCGEASVAWKPVWLGSRWGLRRSLHPCAEKRGGFEGVWKRVWLDGVWVSGWARVGEMVLGGGGRGEE
jgi:hypothetical protein